MNPSTGTFISMDSYQGSIYDPVTLHKYLYANANPVMYTDPSGYSSETTLKEVATDLTVAGILASSFILANQVALNVFSTLRKNLSVASVVSENISVTQRDWKNLIIDFPSHNYAKEWIVTTVIWLSSWHLFKAIYEVKETDSDVETPGVPEDNTKEESEETKKDKKKEKNKKEKNKKERGIGGKGWRGDKTWRKDVNRVKEGGTIEDLDGRVPTETEARTLINESGGKYLRTDEAHKPPNPHNFKHINYLTSSGGKGTIKIK